jgi:hypothetical protein
VRAALPFGMFAIQNDAVKFGDVIVAGTRGWSVPERNAKEEDIKIYEREKLRLKLTLEDAMRQRKAHEKIVLMTHFPPFNVKIQDSGFTEIIKEYPVSAVVYGHLHGKDCRVLKIADKNSIKYYLTSCDLVENKLVEIHPTRLAESSPQEEN